MADVFVSYARVDKARVAPLVAAIEARGWSVWWDPEIDPGQEFDRLIAKELEAAAAVLVVWTPKSVESRWVRGEARDGAERGILVPVRFDMANLPIDVRAFHTTDFDDADNHADSPRINEVLRALETVIARRRAAKPGAAGRKPDLAASAAASSHATSSQRRAWGSRRLLIAVASATLLIAIAGLAFWISKGKFPVAILAQSPPAQTIAVLPFENQSGNASNDYLGEGLSEELINRLAGVPGLRVSARTSSAYFGKGRRETVQTIGKTLGVEFLVEGSVRKSGESLRVTAQLVDARTGFHVWSRSFDRKFADVLAIQDEMSLAILDGLEVPVIDKARAAVLRDATKSPAALDFYLRARRLDQEWDEAANEQAIGLYEKAISVDPAFAAAYLRLANAIAMRSQASLSPPADSKDALIEPYIRKAIELDPDSADAHAILARLLLGAFDMGGMQREMRAAESLGPNSELALFHLTQLYAFVGWPPEKAIEYAEQWAQIDPLNPWASCNVAIAQGFAFRFEDALRTMDRVIERNPEFWVAHYVRTWPLVELGRIEEAFDSAQRAFELHPGDDTRSDLAAVHARIGETRRAREMLNEIERPFLRSSIALALGDLELALSEAERSFAEGDHFVVNLLVSPDMLPLHGRPEFQRMVRRLGLERRIAYTAEHARDRRRAPD